MFSSPLIIQVQEEARMAMDKNPAVYHPQHQHWYHRNAHVFKRLARVSQHQTSGISRCHDCCPVLRVFLVHDEKFHP